MLIDVFGIEPHRLVEASGGLVADLKQVEKRDVKAPGSVEDANQ